ncbi:putative aldouronate transport system permease protein [Paenibacillus algorifonticola]|uniref:Putative aldouronate transport system permease protein n=1 Tax=Paenibacillus algorifonticola TaxID=684063 RepID=A0A1I2DAX3_9BACL|nr:ABC transporter permease subunit [Paenibacillus algorifonticola]SFE77677.1 putative aldouronate transport system permease protein [Paenibacillus algorifonticola]
MSSIVKPTTSKNSGLLKRMWDAKILYLILLPGLIHLILFKLLPLFGLVIAFQDYSIFKGILDSKWIGIEHFSKFMSDPYFWKLVRNTLLLAFFNLLFVFPIPIIFALFVNEVRLSAVKRFVQTLSFFPYFISSAVIVSILYKVLSPQGGLVNQMLNLAGFESVFFMADPGWFRPLYVMLNVWQLFGYSAIIYMAAMTSIDPHLYEAADIDGANRFKKIINVTLPSISSTIVVMFILAIGQILTVDLDKILLMYNPSIYDTADVIQSYVYRQAFASDGFPNYSFGAAVGLMQSVIAFVLVMMANKVSKKYSESRLF